MVLGGANLSHTPNKSFLASTAPLRLDWTCGLPWRAALGLHCRSMLPRFASLPVFQWHERSIHVPRTERIAEGFAQLAPHHAQSMLDVGCGDGVLARRLADRLSISELHGVDIKLRPNAIIDVRAYDGTTLPFSDESFDLISIADVLHHAQDPAVVIRECLRVLRPSGAFLIKDHFRFTVWSQVVLHGMDAFGNYASGVFVRGNYLSAPEWIDLITRSGGTVDKLVWPFLIHDLPWRLVTRSEYQFLARVRRNPTS